MPVPEDETLDAPETTQAPPQPKSAYQLPTKKNTVLRNMLWALGLTMAVVVAIGIGFFGVGSNVEREPLENSELDVAESAERAQVEAGFPVAVPQLEDGWSERSARFTDGESPRWQVKYSSPQGSLVTLTEESGVSASLLSSALPGTVVEEEMGIEGAQCQVLSGGEEGSAQLGVSCEGEDFGLLVHGETDREELLSLTEAALADIQDGPAA